MRSTRRTRCGEMHDCEIFGARLVTVDDSRVAVAGLCHADFYGECEKRIRELSALEFNTSDPTEIDVILARKLSELFDGPAVAVGATVYIKRISNQVFRTDGVLGRPETETEDAECELEQLDDDVWMYTVSGGPGWVGFFSREKAEQLAQVCLNESAAYPIKVNEAYRRLIALSPESYIFISDGTGYDSMGFCAAKHGNKELFFAV